MPNSDPMESLVRISVPVLAPLSPSQDTTSDQLASFYRPAAIPFVRHSPLPVSALSAHGAVSASAAQTAASKAAYGATINRNQIPISTSNQGVIPPIQRMLANLSAVSFQGAWSASTVYALGASVDYLGSVYVSLANANVGNTPSSSPSFWQAAGSNTSVFLGAWNSATAYVLGNQVTFSGTGGNAYYISLTSNTNHQPDTHPSDWQQIGSPNSDVFIGAYSGATAYLPGNQVTYQGSFWICISATTGNAPGIGSSFWDLVGTSAILLGAWSNSTAYPQGAEVTYINYIFKALQANTNQTPPTPPATNAFWVQLGPANIAKGVDGSGNVLLKNIANATGSTSNPTISVTGGTTTYAVIPEMTITATFAGNKVLITFTGSFDLNLGSSASASFAIFKDSVQLTTDYKLAPAYSIVEVPMIVSITFIDAPSAASHTYDIRWQTHATGTVTQTAEGTARTMQIVELG